MYESLKTYLLEFHIYIFAFDDLSFRIMNSLDLKNATIVSLNDFETPELQEVKNKRSKAEYCWTCTPAVIKYVISEYGVPDCTYLDSDLIFYSDPSVLINEMYTNHKNVLITEHNFSPLARIYEEKRAGRFCVQFITFTNERNSLDILEKWKSQCLDWCYARHEDGKFGDQKYLAEWPKIYKNVHILKNPGAGIAPWNIQQYRFYYTDNNLMGEDVKRKKKFKIVFYHFQYVKYIADGIFDIGWYCISSEVMNLFYKPYLAQLVNNETILHEVNSDFKTPFTKTRVDNFKSLLKFGLKRFLKFNIIKIII